jgi:hypothetical protein
MAEAPSTNRASSKLGYLKLAQHVKDISSLILRQWDLLTASRAAQANRDIPELSFHSSLADQESVEQGKIEEFENRDLSDSQLPSTPVIPLHMSHVGSGRCQGVSAPEPMARKPDCIYLPVKSLISFMYGPDAMDTESESGSNGPASFHSLESVWREMAQNLYYPDFSVFSESVRDSEDEEPHEYSVFDVSLSSDTHNASFFPNNEEPDFNPFQWPSQPQTQGDFHSSFNSAEEAFEHPKPATNLQITVSPPSGLQ